MSKGLKLPIIRGKALPPSIRSMDQIEAWIEQDYQIFFRRDVYEAEKDRLSVNARFKLQRPEAGTDQE